jgi:hypothetical protein
MRASIADDDMIQLSRIDNAIAAFHARRPAEQNKSQLLLAALHKERRHILHCNARAARSLTSQARGLSTAAAAPGAAAEPIAMEATP